jgi:hypothetical protein
VELNILLRVDRSRWDADVFDDPHFFVTPRFPDPKDIVAAGGKVEGSSTEFHCVNGVCDGKVSLMFVVGPLLINHI